MMNREKKDLMVFGYGLPVILSVFGTISFFKRGWTSVNMTFFSLAAVMLAVTLFQKEWLKGIYRIWMKGARFIGEIVSTIIFIVIFYTIFTPVGIILRIMRKDILDQKINRAQKSYWQPRPERAFEPQDSLRQF
jgi:hypothetical protein